jgi:hypothetical protein
VLHLWLGHYAVTRNRASAKAAGSSFERLIANWLAVHVSEFIDRRVKTGAKDKGDLSGVRAHGQRVVIEAKDYGGKYNVGPWLTEADIERGNDDALVGAVVAKRRGTRDPGDQVVIMTLRDLAALLTGRRP